MVEEQVWAENPNGLEGKARLRQDHHRANPRSGLTWPCAWYGVRLPPSVVCHPVSKNEQLALPIAEN